MPPAAGSSHAGPFHSTPEQAESSIVPLTRIVWMSALNSGSRSSEEKTSMLFRFWVPVSTFCGAKACVCVCVCARACVCVGVCVWGETTGEKQVQGGGSVIVRGSRR